jgi:perosamine synthetase
MRRLDLKAKPDFIPVAKPLMDEREADATRRVILSGWVTQGKEVKTFEEEFANLVGSKHACAVSSCTTALHLALRAVGVTSEDEVIAPSHSFIATANAIRYCGATPLFVDIDPQTFNIDPAKIEKVISSRTGAILTVHQVGMPCDMRAIMEIAGRYHLPVIEDAACAIGSQIRWQDVWQMIGRPHGDIACFSFHPRKLITTGDGGMLTTNNPEYDRKFRLWRQHSMSVPDAVRHGSSEVIFEEYPELGFNYRMTDIQAAVGRVQLTRLGEIISHRQEQVKIYRDLLKSIAGLGLPLEPEWARSNWQSFCVRLPDGSDQRLVMQAMLDAGIATRRGVMCSHREPAYRNIKWSCGENALKCNHKLGKCKNLPASEAGQDKTIILPLYHQMTIVEQHRVAETLKGILS